MNDSKEEDLFKAVDHSALNKSFLYSLNYTSTNMISNAEKTELFNKMLATNGDNMLSEFFASLNEMHR